jgi:alpha-tubulin suppressor-like RCC1 family protein
MRTRSFAIGGTLVLAALGCRDDAGTPVEPAGVEESVTAAAALVFWQVSGGSYHTCGVTTDRKAYCWGVNGSGQLGDGTNVDRDTPVLVLGGLAFKQVSAGNSHTCGVTTGNQAYCWGENTINQLGNGGGSDRSRPVPVAGGLSLRMIDAGFDHTCAIATDNRVWCWGSNDWGELGNGTRTEQSVPALVAGGLRFRQINAATNWSCGITTDYRAYCWGSGGGKLGDSTMVALRTTPAPVAGGRFFTSVSGGLNHTCGVTTDHRAYCWGYNGPGLAGTGKTYSVRTWPRLRVAGDAKFTRIAAGSNHTCAEAFDDRTFCWGENQFGQLGDGTTDVRSVPVAVAGGLSFAQVTAGGHGEGFSCGKTAAGMLYCWGGNSLGQLGDGTTEHRLVPTPVAEPR